MNLSTSIPYLILAPQVGEADRSILHSRYFFDSSRHRELSLCAFFKHSKYSCIGRVHSPSWSSGNDPFSGGRGGAILPEPTGPPNDMRMKSAKIGSIPTDIGGRNSVNSLAPTADQFVITDQINQSASLAGRLLGIHNDSTIAFTSRS
jgi:hypothetical protein